MLSTVVCMEPIQMLTRLQENQFRKEEIKGRLRTSEK